jgi:hypothetical protein
VPVMHIGRRRDRGCCFHLAERINLVVITKTSPDRLGTYAQERGCQTSSEIPPFVSFEISPSR